MHERVDSTRAIVRLAHKVLVQGIARDALHVVMVVGHLLLQCTCGSRINPPSNTVHIQSIQSAMVHVPVSTFHMTQVQSVLHENRSSEHGDQQMS